MKDYTAIISEDGDADEVEALLKQVPGLNMMKLTPLIIDVTLDESLIGELEDRLKDLGATLNPRPQAIAFKPVSIDEAMSYFDDET